MSRRTPPDSGGGSAGKINGVSAGPCGRGWSLLKIMAVIMAVASGPFTQSGTTVEGLTPGAMVVVPLRESV
jgi:hypothetical protein